MAAPIRLTSAEYFALDEASERKFELIDGKLYMMAGGSPDHAQVSFTVGAILRESLKGGVCRGYSSDLRVALPHNTYAYPDHTVICGDVEVSPENEKTVTNPTAVFEVLSDSTESYDRGLKRSRYSLIPSIKAIVLIDPDRPYAEVYERQPDGTFSIAEIEGLHAAMPLRSFGIEIRFSELYEGASWNRP